MNKKICLTFFLLACIVCNAQVQGKDPIKTSDKNKVKSGDSSLITLPVSGGNPPQKKKVAADDNTGINRKQVSGNNPPIQSGANNTGRLGSQGPDTSDREIGTSTPPYYENQNAVNTTDIKWVYSSIDSTGHKKSWATFDNPSDLARFKNLGLSITLLIFSFYLFYVSTKIYRQYFDKKASEDSFTFVFFGCVALLNIAWLYIVMELKNIPSRFLWYEFLHFPNQFVLGVMLSSLLLFSVGIFRFTLIAFIPNSNDTEKILKDSRFSFIGLIFGIASALANILTIWQAFK